MDAPGGTSGIDLFHYRCTCYRAEVVNIGGNMESHPQIRTFF